MDTKKIQSLIRRIKKAQSSLSVGGSMGLWMEFQGYTFPALIELSQALAAKGISSSDLNAEIQRREVKA